MLLDVLYRFAHNTDQFAESERLAALELQRVAVRRAVELMTRGYLRKEMGSLSKRATFASVPRLVSCNPLS